MIREAETAEMEESKDLSERIGRRTVLFLIICLLIGGLLQYWEFSTRKIILFDGATYIRNGEEMARLKIRSEDLIGGSSTVTYGVGYPLLVAVFGKVLGNYESGAHLSSFVAALLIILAAFFTIRKTEGAQAALFAAGLFAFNSYRSTHGALASRMLPFFLCVIFQVYYTVSFVRTSNKKDFFWMTLWSAAAYCTRLEGIFVFAVSLFSILAHSVYVSKSKSAQTAELTKLIMWGTVLFLLFSSPYIALRIYGGENPLIESSATVKMMRIEKEDVSVLQILKAQAVKYGKQFFFNFTGKFHDSILPRVLPPAVMFLSGAGFLFLLRRDGFLPFYFGVLFTATAVCFCFLTIFEYEKRYFAYLIFPAYYLCSVALAEIWNMVSARNRLWGGVVVMTLIFACIGPELKTTARNCLIENPSVPEVVRTAGTWLAQTAPRSRVSGIYTLPAYYSNASRWTGDPPRALENIVSELKERKTDYLIVDTRGAASKNPELLTLAPGRKDIPGLTLLKTCEETNCGDKLYASVYRVE